MNLSDAETMAKTLIKQHCPEYTFKFNKRKRALGLCNYQTKTIFLSKHFTKLNNETIMLNTVLHEIAHALTPKNGHGPEWKQKALSIGCNAQRTNHAISPPGKYQYQCSNCKYTVQYQRKKTTISSCKPCCIKHNNGKYTTKYELQEVKI